MKPGEASEYQVPNGKGIGDEWLVAVVRIDESWSPNTKTWKKVGKEVIPSCCSTHIVFTCICATHSTHSTHSGRMGSEVQN